MQSLASLSAEPNGNVFEGRRLRCSATLPPLRWVLPEGFKEQFGEVRVVLELHTFSSLNPGFASVPGLWTMLMSSFVRPAAVAHKKLLPRRKEIVSQAWPEFRFLRMHGHWNWPSKQWFKQGYGTYEQ